ncbi:DUF4411 family protein [Micromonospora humida]|uniref:DUF4411 family protein n=1 Tax=Micromonospora humida TaxID=2809018 RepID=UPI00343A7C5F
MSANYSIDTSSIIEAWHRRYPLDAFPGLWQGIDELVSLGRLQASEEVRQELKKKDDELYAWAKERPQLFREADLENQLAVRSILQSHPKLVNTQKGRSQADPFVIALARVRKCVVVTNEVALGSLDRPRIPDVCHALGISCINFLGLIRQEKWIFHR